MTQRLDLEQVLDRFQPGMTVFVPGMSGESLALYEALRARPDAARGVRFVGAHFPGINRSDYLGLHPEARQRGYFMLPAFRKAGARAELLPIDYPGAFRDLANLAPVDIAFAQVSPPDEQGMCSLGVCCDFQPAVWARARQRIAHNKPRMPRTNSTRRSKPGTSCWPTTAGRRTRRCVRMQRSWPISCATATRSNSAWASCRRASSPRCRTIAACACGREWRRRRCCSCSIAA
jgi:acyl-CoA hydrolase